MRPKSSPALVFISIRNLPSRILAAMALAAFALIAAGCMGDQIDATNKLVQQQQEQLEHQQQELEALQANQNQGYTPGVAASPRGGCDKDVETVASKRGGGKISPGGVKKALGYYQDAPMCRPHDEGG